MKFFTISILLFVIVISLNGQGRFDEVEIKATKVTDQIYMLEGSGGNIAILKGEDGVLMVDSQFAPLSEKIKAAINKLSDHPVKYLANTHWHGDHTGGNENFGNEDAIIIAHENVRTRLSSDQFSKAFNRTTKASPKAAWPAFTFSEDMQLHFNDEDVAFIHVHNAHTDGDAFVYFSGANVIHMGDTFFNGRFPYIDLGSGGSVQGLQDAIMKALMIVDTDTQIIPGHGNLASRGDLKTYYEVVSTVHDRVKKAVADGKSLEEIKAAGFTSEFEGWGSGFISDERFIDIIWTDLNRED